MRYAISRIETKKPISEEVIDINIGGKNLIITGNNGCGKTIFLKRIEENLKKLVIETGDVSLDALRMDLKSKESSLNNGAPGESHYQYYLGAVKELKSKINELESFKLTIDGLSDFKISYHSNKSFIRFFSATRQSDISQPNNISSIPSLINESNRMQNTTTTDAGTYFERYIISLLNYGVLSSSKYGNQDESSRVNEWFEKINNDLRNLFEDSSLILHFDIENLCIKINQDGKEPYHLNQLSSGYSSILSIYADLLMRVELRKTSRDEVSGIVLIDEIDAHLHVSLQRKIFSFFKSSFPNVQFIITTHSPFVVQSVDDAVIYDLGKLERMEDLSSYSYESIIKGLLGEKSTSDLLEEKLKEIGDLTNEDEIDVGKLRAALETVKYSYEKLDSRSKAFYLVGQNKLIEIEQDK